MTTHEPILARLAALKAMSVKELKAEWQTLFDAPERWPGSFGQSSASDKWIACRFRRALPFA
ncbi:hypothetical protein BAL199_00140, partial [alpha proteobacterium BAL199]